MCTSLRRSRVVASWVLRARRCGSGAGAYARVALAAAAPGEARTWRYLAGKGSLRPGISSRRCRLRQCNAERGKRISQNKAPSVWFSVFDSHRSRNPNRFRRTVREITDRLFLVAAEGVANSLDASDLQAPVAHAASGMQHATVHAACSVKRAMHHAHCGQRSRVIQLRCMCRRTGWCPTLNGFVKYR